MDLQARLKLKDDKKRKVVLRNASGEMVGMMTLQEPSSCSGSLDQLQRQIDNDMRRRGDPDMSRAVAAAGDGGRLVVTDATPEELGAFERRLNRLN
jgi:hypothetical protein